MIFCDDAHMCCKVEEKEEGVARRVAEREVRNSKGERRLCVCVALALLLSIN